ncbi:uncharacterized protein N7484_008630 [Penicillium longicatenatum]|uniref:uncharacterized protein n=1 Tax=Penicillium longicatenatum TaxID=1561947 RepID=UPI00254725F9|nr:uncharacterized protein N7484_008630 [Penicillium longicatenatum]KAJ5635317.1 hypothetical protein N7484_008630 [Penicillium longicatenatum]
MLLFMRRQAVLVTLLAFWIPFANAHTESAESWITDIWDRFKEAVDCTSCQLLLGGLKLVAGFGDDFMVDVLTGVCALSGAEDPDVCAGVIASEGPSVHYSLMNLEIGSHTANTFCASLVGLCSYPKVREYDLAFPAPKPSISRPPPSGKPPIKVVHFSDTHVDLAYETGSNYACSKPICCRTYNEDDAPGNTSSPCGPWGNSRCDPPHRLQESMNAAIANLTPAFSIYTGDVVAHDVWLVDKSEVLQNFNSTYGAMENSLGQVYAALGNHDAAPLNLFPSSKVPSTYNPQWAYDALTANWMALTGLPSIESADEYGSYSALHPNSNLRIISYNSIFYYKYNFFAYTEPMEHDPNNQLKWLIDELQAAEKASERVWLISHIPSGNSDHFHDHSHYIDQIVQRYDATIAALFFGHTHLDEFQISYSDYNNRRWDTATAMGYIAPSMTPTSGPPSFRVYNIDPVTFGVLDYTQYIADISDPEQTSLEWVPYYSAKEAYGSKLASPVTDPGTELSPAFWHNVSVAMENDPQIFGDFWARRSRGYQVPNCTGDCISGEICALRGADAQYNCYVQKVGFSFEKRDSQEGVRERVLPECNHAGMAPLLAKIARRARAVRDMEKR